MSQPAAEFWNFAQEVYAREGVARLCLELQDRHGANVMVLLFLCWCATRGVDIAARNVAEAHARIEHPDRHLVRPLRAARRMLAQAANALDRAELAQAARRVHATELEAERCEGALLAQSAPPAEPRAGELIRVASAIEHELAHGGLQGAPARTLAHDLAALLLAVDRAPASISRPGEPRV